MVWIECTGVPGALGVTAKRPVSRGGCKGLGGSSSDMVMITDEDLMKAESSKSLLSVNLGGALTLLVAFKEISYLYRREPLGGEIKMGCS